MAVFILLSTPLLADESAFTTANVFNGHMWQLMSATQKISHLSGIQEGIILALNQIKQDLHIPHDLLAQMKASGIFDRRRILFTSQGITAIENRINIFYRDPKNLNIPIMDAYQHVTLEINFADAKQLENNLANLRHRYRE
jgi:hypothetical protein